MQLELILVRGAITYSHETHHNSDFLVYFVDLSMELTLKWKLLETTKAHYQFWDKYSSFKTSNDITPTICNQMGHASLLSYNPYKGLSKSYQVPELNIFSHSKLHFDCVRHLQTLWNIFVATFQTILYVRR
jgi:hypothetical protein